ncbi:peptide ABC transporter permease [Sphaerisporangium krabiense]|uniref:Peptide/nickel transport system substrate-binding protein n=1 Tax=Sphaerisporangium krabiense TaxID=763782 RepID=A0A7W8YYV4_9ACTN|nr:ABC transporter substrate-binding protein [Sphaerisporangium krabiense]MBB5624359.1 peptide/nickel transport system substrate-binding protein [Sphaerisporangium krabiense]GII61688.1 peptide ABC transporter permease [Sphaerisporangium krabiense]
MNKPYSLRASAPVALAVTAALLLAACGGPGTASTGASGGAPRPGGTLTFGLSTDPISINPRGAGAGNDALYVSRQLVDSLTEQDPATGRLIPWLAAKWEVGPDARTFTFTLRDGVTFSDGSPVTARSVKDNFDDIVKAGAKAPSSIIYFNGYKATHVVDRLTAKVEFTTPNAAFLQASSTAALGLLGPSTLATPVEDRDTANLAGSGPFTLDHYTRGSEVVLRKRKGYDWGPADRKHRGEAYLDTVVFKIIPEAGVRTGALQSGQIAAIGTVPPQNIRLLRDSGYTLVIRPNPGNVFSLLPNHASPVFKDVRVRQALAKAVNAREIRDTVLTPDFAVATSVLSRTTPDWTDLSGAVTYDPEAAKRLLDAAGWTAGPDGVRQKDGTKLVLATTWLSNFGPNQSALELIQQQVAKVGFKLELKSYTVPELLQVYAKGDFDLSWGNQSRADGDVLRVSFGRTGSNYYKVDDPELEKALAGQLAAGDAARRAARLAEAQRLIVEQAHAVPVFELTTVVALSRTAHGIELGADSRLQQLGDAWVSGPGA